MKQVLCFLFIVIVTASIFSLDETKTIGDTEFLVIQDACAGGDDLINHYYYQIFNSRDDSEDIFDERGSAETYHTDDYVKKALVGAVGVGLSNPAATALLDEAFDFLFEPDPIISPYYLSIANDVIPYLTKPECDSLVHPEIPYESAGRKGLDIGYMLENLAGIVDMLWWYDGHPWTQEQFQDTLSVKLDSLASFAYRRLLYSRPKGMEVDSTNTGDYDLDWDHIEWPAIHDNNFRLRANGALGYAGVVLEDSTYINFVDEELLDYAGGYSSYHILLVIYI